MTDLDRKNDEAIEAILSCYTNKHPYVATDVMINGKPVQHYVADYHGEAVERLRKVQQMRGEKVTWE